MQLSDLQTGDILLFDPTEEKNTLMWFFSWAIKEATHSIYSHCAIVLRDPTFIDPHLKGLYFWESGWEGSPDPQDGKTKLGVQITPLYECLKNYKGKLYVRRLEKGKDCFTTVIMDSIHKTVYNKPYDTVVGDWLGAIVRKDACPQKTDRFWCSAFVAYILVQVGFLKPDVDWSIIRPSDLSSGSDYLTLLDKCQYGKDCEIYSDS